MGTMQKAISAALVVAFAVAVAPASTPKPPTEIVRTVSRPFCSAIHTSVGPAIGTLIQNDHFIAKAPPLLVDFNKFQANGDTSSGAREMALLKMENLVSPLVGNIASIEKILDSAVYHNPPRNAEDRRLLDIRNHLLAVLAQQKTSLDIINGFVQTKQLGQIQHASQSEMNGISSDAQTNTVPLTQTPSPYSDPNQAGLQPDQKIFDPNNTNQLSVGPNKITHLNDALAATQREAQLREAAVAKNVLEAVNLCSGRPAQATPKPVASP